MLDVPFSPLRDGSSQKSLEDPGQQERLPLLRAGQMDCIFDVKWGKWVENREKTRQPSLGSRCVFEEIDNPNWMGKKESVSQLENPPGNLARQIQESAKLAKTAKLGLCETMDVPLSIPHCCMEYRLLGASAIRHITYGAIALNNQVAGRELNHWRIRPFHDAPCM
jgi:hypothetical protein